MAFDEYPDYIREMIEQAIAGTGIDSDHVQIVADREFACGFSEDGERGDMIRVMRSNLLRNLFLGGFFEKALWMAMSSCATADMNSMLEQEPITQVMWGEYLHICKHVLSDVMSSLARDAVEPYIAALDDQGKYARNEAADFVCITARIAQDNKGD